MKRLFLAFCFVSLVWACGFDDTLREYLNTHFWLPFAKNGNHFAKADGSQLSAPFAGMGKPGKLRDAYEKRQPLEDASLTPREQEEASLIDAKIDIRSEAWDSAKTKLIAFLGKAKTPEYLSEARGWLAHVHYRAGDQTAAGKIYLDELSRRDSNLSRETLVTSLRLTYGYDGGPKLLAHLEEYFDTPEHAAFAIQLVTNPRWDRWGARDRPEPVVTPLPPYERIKTLFEKHGRLFQSENGANTLALLAMRTALRAGDPPAALRIAAKVPAKATVRAEPDFLWMLASAHYLSRNYAAAERPLLQMFRSDNRAAAAYGLCGVYQKTGNWVEQIRFALWLSETARAGNMYLSYPSMIEDQSVYWAVSGWDLNLLLDHEAPVEALRAFPGVPLVKYSLAVRLARENQYEEAAQLYKSIGVSHRAARMEKLAVLYREANSLEAKFKLAEYIAANPERLYFNAQLWFGLQSYAMYAAKDGRLNGAERKRLTAGERKLKDDQEELWRAYLILREIVRDAGPTDIGRRAAQLAIQCVRRISDRFEREVEIRAADIELSRFLSARARVR